MTSNHRDQSFAFHEVICFHFRYSLSLWIHLPLDVVDILETSNHSWSMYVFILGNLLRIWLFTIISMYFLSREVCRDRLSIVVNPDHAIHFSRMSSRNVFASLIPFSDNMLFSKRVVSKGSMIVLPIPRKGLWIPKS